jgi:hypothetical protein
MGGEQHGALVQPQHLQHEGVGHVGHAPHHQILYLIQDNANHHHIHAGVGLVCVGNLQKLLIEDILGKKCQKNRASNLFQRFTYNFASYFILTFSVTSNTQNE